MTEAPFRDILLSPLDYLELIPVDLAIINKTSCPGTRILIYYYITK
jgi:hypothetical protein